MSAYYPPGHRAPCRCGRLPDRAPAGFTGAAAVRGSFGSPRGRCGKLPGADAARPPGRATPGSVREQPAQAGDHDRLVSRSR
jgi:hypothetical protein